jgi:hypothetical protein
VCPLLNTKTGSARNFLQATSQRKRSESRGGGAAKKGIASPASEQRLVKGIQKGGIEGLVYPYNKDVFADPDILDPK